MFRGVLSTCLINNPWSKDIHINWKIFNNLQTAKGLFPEGQAIDVWGFDSGY